MLLKCWNGCSQTLTMKFYINLIGKIYFSSHIYPYKPCLNKDQMLSVACIRATYAIPPLITPQWRIQDFPEVGAPNIPGGANIRFCQFFFQKLHEIERIWTPVEALPPLDPPLTPLPNEQTNNANYQESQAQR